MSNRPYSRDLPAVFVGGASSNHRPTDLVTIREAAEQTGISHHTIYRWVKEGKEGRKLPTHYAPGRLELALVSLSAVRGWRDIPPLRKRSLVGGLGLRFKPADAIDIRKLSALMTARIGATISYAEAVRGAVASAILNEEARAKARKAAHEAPSS